MEIKRTANAGVLLRLDGKKILMDGVSRAVYPYPATPPQIKKELLQDLPDALLITHRHEDHYDAAFVSEYMKNPAGPVMGPADIPFCREMPKRVGDIRITPVISRHIGKTEPMGHMSFVLEGSQCIWFLGDASPLLWKNRNDLPRPDVMIVPYAYGMGSGWEICKQLGAKNIVLLHLPPRDADPYGLWAAVEAAAGQGNGPALYIPAMGETVIIDNDIQFT